MARRLRTLRRVHATTKQRPIDRHAEERPHLIALPPTAYEVAELVYRSVDADGFVSYAQNRYSVPWDKTYPGVVLPVKITEDQIVIYSQQIAELVRHSRFPAAVTHQKSQLREHLPPRDLPERRGLLQEQFQKLGGSAVEFLQGLLKTRRHPWEQAQRVLALLRIYRQSDWLAALEHASRFGAFSFSSLERILAVQAQPKSCAEHLADQNQEHLAPLLTSDPIPPRPPAAYQQLRLVISQQAQGRRERAIERRIRQAYFAATHTLEDFDWEFNAHSIDRVQVEALASGEFVRRHDNLILVGQSGLGKSHILQGLGRRFCALGYHVRYTTSADLLVDLTAALADRTLPQRLRYWCRFDLLIIDEFGFDKLERSLSPQAANLLYKVIDARHGQNSTALATNIDFDFWGEYLGDPPLAMAFMDRIVDGALLLKLEGESYRAHRAKRLDANHAKQAG